MNAQEIIDRLQVQLKDALGVRWPVADLVDYISDGQRQLCVLKPNALVVIETVKLTPSTSLQTVPAGSHLFQKANHNMGADGATPGAAINEGNLVDMNRFIPNWRSTTPGAEIEEWLFDYDNPKQYWVYPTAPPTDLYISIQTAKTPATITGLGDDMDVNDLWLPALYEYAMYRALSKNDDAANKQEAELHRQRFYNAIGLKVQADQQQRQRQKQKVE